MRQFVARPGQVCRSELIVGAGLERVRWTAWYYQFWWFVQWNQGMHQGTNDAWDAFWKQAMSRQRKYGWAACSRPGMQWMKKILKCPLMFSSMVQIWLWKRKTGVIVRVCILEESEQGTKAAGGAVPWKQLWQFWNWFDGVQEASAGRPELAFMWQYRDFCATTRARVFWTNWRRARFDADVPTRRENFTIFKARADYCHGYRFCCFSGHGWTNVA